MDELRAGLDGFDPDAPLRHAPAPWDHLPAPATRPGPPYAMTEMIAAQPALARRLVGRLTADGSAAALAEMLRAAAARGGPVVVTGCGTSEHAAMATARILGDAWRAAGLPGQLPYAAQAFELALDPPAQPALVIGVSHEGGTTATIGALAAARAAGAVTAVVTASGGSPAAAGADLLLETVELDTSWCHTVGYSSPLVAASVVGAVLTTGDRLDVAAFADALAERLLEGIGAAMPVVDGIAGALAERSHLLAAASGADIPAAREFVLKVEEASWLPSAMRELETLLHGHLPATGPETGLVLLLTSRAARAERLDRARQALEAAAVLGIAAAAIITDDVDVDLPARLTPAGRIVVPEARALPDAVATLLGTATPLQLLTERVARARGTNPDPIRRDDPRYREASDAAEAEYPAGVDGTDGS